MTGGADQSIKGCIALLMCGFNYDAAHENVSVYFKFFFCFFFSIIFGAPTCQQWMEIRWHIDYDGLLHDAHKHKQ